MKQNVSRSIPPAGLATIRRIALKHDVDQVWLFGSSTNQKGYRAHDIDVALVGVAQRAKRSLARELHATFPGCRVEPARHYTKGNSSPTRSVPYHFLLSSAGDIEFSAQPIARSITRGQLLWRT